jgi:PhnB protein
MATTLTPYLSFGGNTREAFAFYEKALGAKIEADDELRRDARIGRGRRRLRRRHAPERRRIMHACLTLPGGAKLFAGDMPPGMPYEGVKGVMLAIQYDTVDQAHGAFHALSQAAR